MGRTKSEYSLLHSVLQTVEQVPCTRLSAQTSAG